VIRWEISEVPILPQAVLDEVGTSRDGAVVLFLGVVRDHHEGQEVAALDYEAYREMAEGILLTIGEEAQRAFGVEEISMVHRVGSLAVGDISLAVAVASPHRTEAYEASRFLLESIKERLPVWKKEHYVTGTARWVDGRTPTVPNPGPEGETHGRETP
jgi:molybdopterin synthase catalytic subunit